MESNRQTLLRIALFLSVILNALLVFMLSESKRPRELVSRPPVQETEPADSYVGTSPPSVKTLLLVKIAKNLDWGTNSSCDLSHSNTFRIGVVSDKPLNDLVSPQIGEREVVFGKRVIMEQATAPFDRYQLLYFPAATDLAQIDMLQLREQLCLLLIGDEIPGFLDAGGMVQFINRNERVRFELNFDALMEAGLTPASRIVKLAERVIAERHHLPES